MKRCPDCCAHFEEHDALRHHIERYHDAGTLESLES